MRLSRVALSSAVPWFDCATSEAEFDKAPMHPCDCISSMAVNYAAL